MRNKGVAVLGMAVLAGSLIASSAGGQTQLAQTQLARTQLASAMPAPERDVLVFTERGGQLSPTATSAVRGVAAEARSSRVRLVGRPENLAAVKSALEKAGVPAKAISVERDASAGLPRPGDGVNQPADRRVEIKW